MEYCLIARMLYIFLKDAFHRTLYFLTQVLTALKLIYRKSYKYEEKLSNKKNGGLNNPNFPRTSELPILQFEDGLVYRGRQSISDDPKYGLSIVIPAFNEEKRLNKMLNKTIDYLSCRLENESDFSCEIILVDDGSRDRTAEVYSNTAGKHFKRPGLDFKLLKLEGNFGKGRAVTEGILASLGECILFADADGSTDISQIVKMEEAIEANSGNDFLICGSRSHLEHQTKTLVKRSLLRWILMRGFHLLVYLLGVSSVKDTQCGFKLLTRSAARKIVPFVHIDGWIFDVELILLAEKQNFKIVEIPVYWDEVDGTKLKIAVDSCKMARDLLIMRWNYFWGIWKSDCV